MARKKSRRNSRSYFKPVVYTKPFLAAVGIGGAALGFGIPWTVAMIAHFIIHTF